MKKKASMQLGINAIVILIIALAVLGLAMSFITGLFRQSGAKYGAIIDRTDLPFHADVVTPVIFETSAVTVKAGRQESLTVSVYNDKFSASELISLELVNCIDADGQDVWTARVPLYASNHPSYSTYKCLNKPAYPYEPTIAIRTSSQTIPVATDAGYMALVSVNGSVDTGSYICTVIAGKWRPDHSGTNVRSCVDPDDPAPISKQLIINVER